MDTIWGMMPKELNEGLFPLAFEKKQTSVESLSVHQKQIHGVNCDEHLECMNMKQNDDETDHQDENVKSSEINVSLAKETCGIVQPRTIGRGHKTDFDINENFLKDLSICRELDFGNDDQLMMYNNPILPIMPYRDALNNLEQFCQNIEPTFATNTAVLCLHAHNSGNTDCKERLNPNVRRNSKFRIAQQTIYFTVITRGKVRKETNDLTETECIVKRTANNTTSAPWRIHRVVSINLRATPKYMQVCQNDENRVVFDKLETEKSSQGVKDLHQCHFIEEVKLDCGNGSCVCLKRYRCEKTNSYLCITDDGCIGLDDQADIFITQPAKMKAFFVLKDKDTGRQMAVNDGRGHFVTAPRAEKPEQIKDCCKIILSKVMCDFC